MSTVPYVWREGRKQPSREGLGNFYTVGHRIYDPAGNEFVPRGVNVGGTIANNGNGWPDFTFNDAFVQGMKSWNCNTARIVIYVTDKSGWSTKSNALKAGKSEAEANAEVDALADRMTEFYLDRGMVVMMECHDMTQSSAGTILVQVEQFWARYAARWKHEPRVWFNIANEPNLGTDTWLRFTDRVCGVIRNAGAGNIIVCDLMYYASDVSKNFQGATIPRGWEPGRMDYLIERWGNLVASSHNYGTNGTYTSQANIRGQITYYKQAGIPLLYGEVGYPIEGVPANSYSWIWERDAAHNTCAVAAQEGIGVFWWATSFNDAYRLEGTDTNYKAGLTNVFREGAILNPAGVMFKEYLATVAPT